MRTDGPWCAGVRCTPAPPARVCGERTTGGSGVVGVAHADRDEGDALGERLVQNLFGAPFALGVRLWSWSRPVHGGRSTRLLFECGAGEEGGVRRGPPGWAGRPRVARPTLVRQSLAPAGRGGSAYAVRRVVLPPAFYALERRLLIRSQDVCMMPRGEHADRWLPRGGRGGALPQARGRQDVHGEDACMLSGCGGLSDQGIAGPYMRGLATGGSSRSGRRSVLCREEGCLCRL